MTQKVKCVYCGQMHKAGALFCSVTGKEIHGHHKEKMKTQPTIMIKIESSTQPIGHLHPDLFSKNTVAPSPPESERCPICGGFHKKNARFCNVTGERIFRKTCPSCSQEMVLRKPDARFCPLCGGSLGPFCPYGDCKAPVSPTAPFCSKCFQKIQYCSRCNSPNPILQKMCLLCQSPILAITGGWSTFKGSSARAGFSGEELSFPLFIKWSYPSRDEDSQITSNPVIDRGTIYLGDKEGNLHALNQYSGKLRWTRPTKAPIISTPSIDEGNLYLANAEGKVFALDAQNGKILWVYPKRGEEIVAPIEASVLVGSGKVYVAPRIAQSGKLLALDKASGDVLWEFSENAASGESSGIKASPSLYNDILIVATCTGFVYGLNVVTGEKLWRFPREQPLNAQIYATPSVSEGIAYIGDRAGRMYALKVDTGEDTWHFSTEIEGSINSSPSVAKEHIFVGTWAEYLYCLDRWAGGMKWRYQNDKINVWDYVSTSPLILNNKSVLFGSGSGYVYALDMVGNELWKYRLESGIISSPVVSDGFLYVVSANGVLYAFYPRLSQRG